YAPLLYRYARSLGLGHDDAGEARDRCLEVLVRKMPDFSYDPRRGRFKTWLYEIARGKALDIRRRRRETPVDAGLLESLAGAGPRMTEVRKREARADLLRRALERAKARVPARMYRVFERLLLEDSPVALVAAELGISPNQVYKARARVMREIRAILPALERDATRA